MLELYLFTYDSAADDLSGAKRVTLGDSASVHSLRKSESAQVPLTIGRLDVWGKLTDISNIDQAR